MSEFELVSHEKDALAPMASSVRVVAHPAGARWIGVLRRVVEPLRLKVVSAKSIAKCRQTLERWPASLLVLELTPDEVSEQLELLAEARDNFPHCRIVLFQRGMDSKTELLARELGVSEVIAGIAEMTRLKRLVRAHVARIKPRQEELRSQILRDVDLMMFMHSTSEM